MRAHPETIGYLHLKDVDAAVLTEAREQGWSFLEALKHVIFSPLGEGAADIPAILTLLDEGGFDGWVVVEQDTCHGDPTLVARQNREYIARQVGQT
jgi:inosose dehydratase